MRYPPAPKLYVPYDWACSGLTAWPWPPSDWHHAARAVGYVDPLAADQVELALGNLGWALAQAGALQLARRSVGMQWLPGMGCPYPGFEKPRTQESPPEAKPVGYDVDTGCPGCGEDWCRCE